MKPKKKRGFLSMFLGTSGAILLENLLTGIGGTRSKSSNIHGRGLIGPGEGTIKAGEGAIKAGQDS